MFTPFQVLKILEDPFNYKELSESPKVKRNLIQEDNIDLNVFIPVKGRKKYLRSCITYLKHSANESGTAIRIVVIENDKRPHLIRLCRKMRVSYIFIPISESKSENFFAKSLCYNFGYLCTEKTKWNVFHDVDVLVEPDFFEKIMGYLKRDPRWLQPYTKKRVIRVNKKNTKKIFRKYKKILPLNEMCDMIPATPGSPGGSIVVRSSDFEKVNGYDPTLFYGYSVEDSFFWIKLEWLYKKKESSIGTLFNGRATFADDSPIEIYHLNHPFSGLRNVQEEYMLELHNSFLFFDKEVQDMLMEKIINLNNIGKVIL